MKNYNVQELRLKSGCLCVQILAVINFKLHDLDLGPLFLHLCNEFEVNSINNMR